MYWDWDWIWIIYLFRSLYQQLVKYPATEEKNQVLIVETLRSITELLIWGDQHEPKFFELISFSSSSSSNLKYI